MRSKLGPITITRVVGFYFLGFLLVCMSVLISLLVAHLLCLPDESKPCQNPD